MPKPITAGKQATSTPRMSVVLLTMDSHLASAAESAAERLARDLPGLHLQTHSASAWRDSDKALAACLAAVAQAEAIIDAGVKSFMHWMDQRDPARGGVVPLIQQLNTQAELWREAELMRARKLLAKGEPVDTVLEALAKGLTQKMMHGTLAELHAGDAESRAATAHTVSRLFLRSDSRR